MPRTGWPSLKSGKSTICASTYSWVAEGVAKVRPSRIARHRDRLYRKIATLVVLVAAMTPAGASALDARADEVLAAARSYVTSRSYPAYLEYRVVVTLTRDDGRATGRT